MEKIVRMPFIQRLSVLLIAVLFCGIQSLNAQTTWTGATSTDWNVASNWTGGIPDANDDVIIINVANDPVISVAGAVAKSVTIQANGLLTINAAGVLTINSNTAYGFNNSGTVQNNGTIHLGNVSGGWTSSALRNAGIFNNNAGGKINIDNVGDAGQRDALTNVTAATFNNAGEITIGGIANGLNNSGGLYGLRSTGEFNNLQTGIIRIDKITFYAFSNTFVFNNAGQIIIGNSPVPGNKSIGRNGMNAGGTFTNSSTGRIRISNYTTRAIDISDHCIFNNSGSIRAGETGGTTTLMGGGTMPGVLNNKTGGVIEGTGTMIASRFANQGGTLSPGISGGSATAGWMSFDGNMDFLSNIFSIDVNGKATPGVSYDQIGVNGVATLGGTLNVSFNSYTGVVGDQVTILTSTNGIVGKFATVTGLSAGWQINYTATEVILSNGPLSTTAYNVWTGAANISYTNLNNWSKGAIPTTNDDVLIPAGTTNKPTLSGTGGRAKSVTIEAGTSLTISAAGILQINGSDQQGIFNQGTLTNAGTIHIGNTAATGLYGIVNSGTITNSTGGKINIDRASVGAIMASENNINNAGTVTIGAVVATPELIKAEGTGVFNNNTGGIFKGAGMIYNARFANAGGTVSVGAPVGIITFNASKGFNNTTLDMELNGISNAGVDFDRIVVNGTATLGGTLNVTSTYTPAGGDEVLLLTATTVSGTFATVNLPAGWSIQYMSNGVKITYGQNYWTGAVSTSWHTAGNWSTGSIPAATDAVIIPNVSNDPVISAGAAVAQTVSVLSGGLLTINAGQTLTINGSAEQGLLNEGSIQNSGTITIGNTASIGTNGIWNKGTFMNNPGSAINIDRIDLSGGAGIRNDIAKSFTNQGTIRIGANAGTGNNITNTSGLFNQGLFTNSPNAKFYVDRAFRGIYNFAQNSNSFTNHGDIFIGGVATGATIEYGIVTLYNFTNAAGGMINIDRSSTGIDIGSATGLEFMNNGSITFGKSASVPELMLIGSLGAFNNSTGGVIEGSGTISDGNFKHSGGSVMPAWSAPGNSFGKLKFNTNQNISNNILTMNIGGTSNAGVDYDQLVVNGNLIIGGTLNVTASYTAVEGDEITIISATAVTGTFATTNIPAGWTIRYTSTGVKLTFGTNDPNTWTGAVSNVWAVAGNWTKGIPVTGSNVVIPDVARDPVISTTTAVARTVWIQTGGLLTINAASSLTLNGTATQSILNEGTVQNNGSIYIGITAANVTNAIYNLGSFNNNTSAAITINKAAENTNAAIVNASGTFANKGNISIGTGGNAGKYGIINGASFENNAGATISIGAITTTAIQNNNGTFTNAGNIHYGVSAGAADYGIDNAAAFNNNSGGVIGIDRTATFAISNITGSLTNDGIIRIGAIAASGTGGIYNTAVFNNNAAAELRIDRVSAAGISTANPGSFSNAGKIYIGELSAGTSIATGIQQGSAFNNTGTIRINRVTSAITTVANSFTNTGLVDIGALTAVTNLIGFGAGSFSHGANGELRGAGNISASRFSTVDGTFSPGNPVGIINFDGGEDFTRSIFNIEINGNTAGTGFDQIKSSGRVDISSGTTLNLAINYAATAGEQLTIMTGAPLVGTFGTVIGLSAGWSISYTATSVILTYGPTAGATWTGAVNTDWTNTGNWMGGVPGASTDVIIPDVTNDPVISTTTAVAKSIVVNSGAVLTTSNGAVLTLNNSTTQGLKNTGTVQNNGTIHIGNTATTGANGLLNEGSFNNSATGKLNIDRSTSIGLYNYAGSLTNAGVISIGANATVTGTGFQNRATFNNNTGAILNIDRTSSIAFYNELNTLTNTGTINIGANAAAGSDGIDNYATIYNNAGGQININRVAGAGIYSSGIGFVNRGTIAIGTLNTGTITNHGIYFDAILENESGGTIEIDRISAALTMGQGSLYNRAIITIGASGIVPSLVGNATGTGKMFNETGGELRGKGSIIATKFENTGGTLVPGNESAGRFLFNASESFANSTIKIQVNDKGTGGVNFDQIDVQGTATLGGALTLSVNYTGVNGDQISFLTATAVSGTFATVTGLPANWKLVYKTNAVVLEYDDRCYWTGAVSTAWNTSGNWTPKVAGASNSVVLASSGVTRELSVNIGATVSAVQVEAGRTLSITAAGTLTVSNTLTNNGTINGAGRIVNANFTNAGTIAPGTSPGTLSITGNFSNQGTIQAELGGTTAGTQYDRLAVTGAVTLGGNLVISTINGFKPVVGQTYTIITGSSVTGSFASVTWPSGITGTVTNTATGVNLNIVSVLPLTLLEFTGQAVGAKALLKWKTAEEVNTSHFSIERSTDGQPYVAIGNVAAAGSGASSYTFTDANTVNGNNYYRLKMIDIDGSFKYSPVVIVKFANRGEVKISPVPATSHVIFTISDRSLIGERAQVFSPAGNLVASLVLTLSNRIEIAHLPSGIYTVKTSSGTYRFMKQ